MKYRTLGRTGIQVSPYCLGAMMFGAMGNPDHDDSVRIIHRARSKSESVNFHSRVHASTCAANASLSSMRPMSSRVSPVRSSTLAVAGTGPIPIVSGGTPATAARSR
jgi:hypothetical protein